MPRERATALMHHHSEQLVNYLGLFVVAEFCEVHYSVVLYEFVQLVQRVCETLQLDSQDLGQLVEQETFVGV